MVGRSTADIERALLRKGFTYRNKSDRFLTLEVNGEATEIRTLLSHGIDEYGNALLAQISRQLHLTKAELLRLIDCELSGEEYVALLIERGALA